MTNNKQHSAWIITTLILLIGITVFLLQDDTKDGEVSTPQATPTQAHDPLPTHDESIDPTENFEQLVDIKQEDSPPATSRSIREKPTEEDEALIEDLATDADTEDQAEKKKEPFLGLASTRETVPAGGALLMGGWAMPNGDRVFALTSPHALSDKENTQYKVNALIVAVTPEDLKDPDWQSLAKNYDAGLTDSAKVYDTDALNALRGNQSEMFSRILSGPTIITEAGQHATMTVTGDDQGTMLSIIATPGENEGEIDLGVSVADYDGLDLSSDQDQQPTTNDQ